MAIEKIIGIVAGCFTAFATLPQIIKTWRSKDASDISVFMFSVLLAGLILWIIYGFMRSDMPIILTNVVAAILNATMIILKIRYGK